MLIRTISRQQKDLWMRVRWVRTHGCLFSKEKGLTLLFVEAVQAFELAGKKDM